MMINTFFYHSGKASYFGVHLLNKPYFSSMRGYTNDRFVKPFYIIKPDSQFKETWDSVILFMILYTALVEPMRISYLRFEEDSII